MGCIRGTAGEVQSGWNTKAHMLLNAGKIYMTGDGKSQWRL